MEKTAWSMSFIALGMQLTARLSARLLTFGIIQAPLMPNGIRLGFEVGGSVILIISLIIIARSKKRCWAWGLLGIFSFVGMIVAARLKRDKHVA